MAGDPFFINGHCISIILRDPIRVLQPGSYTGGKITSERTAHVREPLLFTVRVRIFTVWPTTNGPSAFPLKSTAILLRIHRPIEVHKSRIAAPSGGRQVLNRGNKGSSSDPAHRKARNMFINDRNGLPTATLHYLISFHDIEFSWF